MATNKEIAEGYRRTAFNYILSHDMKSSDAEQFMNAVETRARLIENSGIDGQYTPAKTAPTPNIFNRYVGKRKEILLADVMWNDFATKNNLYTLQSRTASTPTLTAFYQTTSTIPYIFDWTKGLQRSWVEDEEDSLARRIKNFATEFGNNLNSLVNAYDNKQVVHGADATKQNIYKAALNQLKSLLQKPEGTEYTRTDLRNLAKIVNDVVGPDAEDLFNSYFDGYTELSDAEKQLLSKKKLAEDLLNAGYIAVEDMTPYAQGILNYLTKNKWKLYNKDNRLYALDEEGNSHNGSYIDEESGNIIYFGDDGSYYGSIDVDPNNEFAVNISNIVRDFINQRDQLYTVWNYDSLSHASKSDIINRLERIGTDVSKYIDVSNLFSGDDEIIAIPKDKKINKDKYGNLQLDNLDFYKIGDDGKIYKHNFLSLKNLYRKQGWEENLSEFGMLDDLASKFSINDINYSFIPLGYNFRNNPSLAIKSLLSALANPNNEYNINFLLKIKWGNQETKKNLIIYMYLTLSQDRNIWNSLNYKLKQIFKQLLKDMPAPASEKNGGVLKAALGLAIRYSEKKESDPLKLIKDIEKKAKDQGYDSDFYRMFKDQEVGNLSTYDYLRFMSLAADTVGFVSSLLPGAGTAVAGGAGLTSMGLDFAADIADPSVTKWQTVKNAGINLGSAVIGMIPGAKGFKLTKQLLRYVPQIIAVASASDLISDSSVRQTLSKFGTDESFNRQDWKNLSRIMLAALAGAGGVRATAGEFNARKVMKNSTVETDKVKFKDVNGIPTVDKTTADNVRAAIESGDATKIAEAKTLLKDAGFSDKQVKLAIVEGKKKWFKKLPTYISKTEVVKEFSPSEFVRAYNDASSYTRRALLYNSDAPSSVLSQVNNGYAKIKRTKNVTPPAPRNLISNKQLSTFLNYLDAKYKIKVTNPNAFMEFIKDNGGPSNFLELLKMPKSDWELHQKAYKFNRGGTLGRFNNYLNSKQ